MCFDIGILSKIFSQLTISQVEISQIMCNFPSVNFPKVRLGPLRRRRLIQGQAVRPELTRGPGTAARMDQGAEHCGQNGLGGRALRLEQYIGQSAAARTDWGSCRLENCTSGKLTFGKSTKQFEKFKRISLFMFSQVFTVYKLKT